MSYILDALKKAENAQQSNGVSEREEISSVKTASRWWPALALLAVIINVALVAYIAGRPAPPTPVAATPAVAPVTTGSTAVTETSHSAPAQPAVVAAVPQSLATTTKQDKVRPMVKPLAEEVDIVEHLARSAPPQVLTVSAPTVDTSADNLAVELNVPMLAEMSDAFRQSLPPIKMDVHVYSEQADKRFVLINMVKYREGDSLDNGIMVHRIMPNGLYLSYHNEHFQIAAQ